MSEIRWPMRSVSTGVEHAEPAELSDRDCGVGAYRRIHRRPHHGKIKLEGVELPGDVYVVGVTCPP
jgi:hypothetical protein